MHPQGSSRSDAQGVGQLSRVVLCCPSGDELLFTPLLDTLLRDGFQAEILRDVDRDIRILGDAVDTSQQPSLYVICKTSNLDRSTALRLEGVFGARRGPSDHSVVLGVRDGQSPAVLNAEIRRALGRVGNRRGDPEGAPSLRDVVGVTSMSAVREGQRRREPGSPPVQTADERVPASSTHEWRPAPERASADPARTELSPTSSGAAWSSASRTPASYSRGAQVEGEAASAQTRREAAAPFMSAADVPARQPSPVPKKPTLSPAEASYAAAQEEAKPTPGKAKEKTKAKVLETTLGVIGGKTPAPARWRFGVVLIGVATLGAVIAFALLSGIQRITEEEEPLAEAEDEVFVAPKRAPLPAELVAEQTRRAHQAEQTKADESVPSAAGVSAGAPAEPVPEQKDPKVAVAGSAEETARIAAALRDGELRALDAWLIAPDNQAEMEWGSAARYCRSRNVHGVGGFRLPAAKELIQLRRARMTKKGNYWSGTLDIKKGEGNTHVRVLDGGSARMVTTAKTERARALCVRAR